MKKKNLSILVQKLQEQIYDIMHLNTDNRREIEYLHTRLNNLDQEHVYMIRALDEAISLANELKESIKNG